MVVVVIAIVILFVVPIPRSFSAQLSSSVGGGGRDTLSFPTGSQVSGSWTTNNGGSVTLTITDSSGGTVYSSDSSGGSFSFTASSPPYGVSAASIFAETVSVTGTYSTPLL